jgi:hypothetical protein
MKLVIRAFDNMGDLQYEAEVEDVADELIQPPDGPITLASVKLAFDAYMYRQANAASTPDAPSSLF